MPAALPLLSTPLDLWEQAIELGQACRQIGQTVLSLDLLVAVVALHHNAIAGEFRCRLRDHRRRE